MKKSLLFAIEVLLATALHAQVTQINSNKSLSPEVPLGNDKAILISKTDSTLWVTDATSAGTKQLSPTIIFKASSGILNNKLIFVGTTAATGEELFITDGTTAGTVLLKDVYLGSTGSFPDQDFALLNGFVYFTAATPAEGRELWRTDGTPAGTTLVKDIVPGATGSNTPNNYNLFSNSSYLLFSAQTATTGSELWISDGTNAGTKLLADINPGAASSNADNFASYNNIVLFKATDAINGTEIWKTNGTAAGTQLVKDINPGTANSITFAYFYAFNGKMVFNANNGVNGEELWITDGTTGNTHMIKDIDPGVGGSAASLFSVVQMGTRMIFTASDHSLITQFGEVPTNYELWETDGTDVGTHIFKEIVAGNVGSNAFILPAITYDNSTQKVTYPLFQGNKFFLIANTPATGTELWISDGTANGTTMVKDIYQGTGNGVSDLSYVYTSSALYFSANDSIHGEELWKSDGTLTGTSMVANINTTRDENGLDANSNIQFSFFIINNAVIFEATNGDDPIATDLYRLDGSFTPLPVNLSELSVKANNADAVLQWTTLTEINTKDFTIQRSGDGVDFINIGTVAAAGSSAAKLTYWFTDEGIMNSGKDAVYYKLVTTDKDGKTATSKIISLKLKEALWNVKLISNLVRSDLDIMLNGVTQNVRISIKDVSGKTIGGGFTTSANGHMKLSAAQLTPGMYLLVAESNNERKVLRFVKQ